MLLTVDQMYMEWYSVFIPFNSVLQMYLYSLCPFQRTSLFWYTCWSNNFKHFNPMENGLVTLFTYLWQFWPQSGLVRCKETMYNISTYTDLTMIRVKNSIQTIQKCTNCILFMFVHVFTMVGLIEHTSKTSSVCICMYMCMLFLYQFNKK